jgi:hypothetical protein
MALTQNIEVKAEIAGRHRTRLSNGTDVLYKGALVNVIQSTGKILVAADTATHKFDGYVAEYVSAVADTPVKVVQGGCAWFAHTGAAQTDLGKPVWATGDDTLTIIPAANVLACGEIEDVDVTGARWLVNFDKAQTRDITT